MSKGTLLDACSLRRLLRLAGRPWSTGHEDAHTELVSEARRAHRRKRNLIGMLDAQERPAPCP